MCGVNPWIANIWNLFIVLVGALTINSAAELKRSISSNAVTPTIGIGTDLNPTPFVDDEGAVPKIKHYLQQQEAYCKERIANHTGETRVNWCPCLPPNLMKEMNSRANAGLSILNETEFPVTCTCSMIATHRYENHVQPGQIFYRWPGAVWMTLAASRTTESTMYTDNRCRNEFSLVSLAFGGGGSSLAGSIGANIIANMVETIVSSYPNTTRAISILTKIATFFFIFVKVLTYIASLIREKVLTSERIESKKSYENALRSSNLETSQIGCYAGRDGTWLILSGGPQRKITSDGKVRWSPRDFTFRQASRAEVWTRGEFTEYSSQCYYDRPDSQMPEEVRGNPPKRQIETSWQHA